MASSLLGAANARDCGDGNLHATALPNCGRLYAGSWANSSAAPSVGNFILIAVAEIGTITREVEIEPLREPIPTPAPAEQPTREPEPTTA